MPNPYIVLKKDFRDFVAQIDRVKASGVFAFFWEKADVNSTPNLRDIREQVSAADKLGFETIVSTIDGKLEFHFRKSIPSTPYV